MPKRKIVVKDALKDIRSGMSDIWIMRKYRIDARGLQSLLKKLVERGDLKPADVEERITGLTYAQVLTEDQVRDLSKNLEKTKTPKAPSPSDRTVRAVDLVRDIREGLDDYELMDKYSLSAKGIKNVFDKLVQAGSIRREELDARMPAYDSTVDLGDVVREMGLEEMPTTSRKAASTTSRESFASSKQRTGDPPRDLTGPDFGIFQNEPKAQTGGTVVFPVPIINVREPQTVGRLQDVSETEVLAVGVRCKTGDAGVFVVKPEAFGPIMSFKFAAKCRWVSNETGEQVTALTITQIAEPDMEQLRKVIQTLTI